MCSTCSSKNYGQDQPEARKADIAKLEKVRASMESKSLDKLKG